MNIPENVKFIMDRLKSNGFECVVVGGCVRDSLIDKEPDDWDLATSATPDEVMEVFPDMRIEPTGIKHGTVSIIIDHIQYEITTYRIDGKYSDHRRPDKVKFTRNIEDDLSRRDFTVNAIAFDGENIIDPFGGIDDLSHKIIRCVGNPDDRFQEDPLRILRAIRFASKYKMEIEEETSHAMFKFAPLLERVAIERKTKEFSKTICCSDIGWILSKYKGILYYIMPEINYVKKDRWKKATDCLGISKDLAVNLAIIIDSFDVKETNSILYLLSRLKLSNSLRWSIMNILDGRSEILTTCPRSVRLLLSKYPETDVLRICEYKLSKCDKEIAETFSNIYKIIINEIERDDKAYLVKHLNINGHDLKEIGVKDLEIKDILNSLLLHVINDSIPNNKKDLIDAVKISRL